jgi:hypothetical protein
MSTISTPSGTTTITRDPGGNLLSEQNPTSGMLLAKAKGRARPRSLPATGGSTYYYLTDGGGSVVALTDSSGNLVDQYSYDPQGNYTSQSGSVPNSFGYGGMTYDTSTSMYSVGNGGGYYDPGVGQFSQGGSCDAYGGGGMCMEFNDYNPFEWSTTQYPAQGLDVQGCQFYLVAFAQVRGQHDRGHHHLFRFEGFTTFSCNADKQLVTVDMDVERLNFVFGLFPRWDDLPTGRGEMKGDACSEPDVVAYVYYVCPEQGGYAESPWYFTGSGVYRVNDAVCVTDYESNRDCGRLLSTSWQL